MKTINVTPDYHLVVKDALNIVVERLVVVLPPVGKPAPVDFVARREWRDIGNYGRTYAGLQAALKSIILEAAIDGLAPCSELADLAASLRAVASTIDASLSPQIDVPIGVIGD